ncbi:MAG: hypothetical protein F4Z01_03365 [Gammaproteobacteria bacterium]|nr:hypothetical protein [Gammaproteobacteria bacterium]
MFPSSSVPATNGGGSSGSSGSSGSGGGGGGGGGGCGTSGSGVSTTVSVSEPQGRIAHEESNTARTPNSNHVVSFWASMQKYSNI